MAGFASQLLRDPSVVLCDPAIRSCLNPCKALPEGGGGCGRGVTFLSRVASIVDSLKRVKLSTTTRTRATEQVLATSSLPTTFPGRSLRKIVEPEMDPERIIVMELERLSLEFLIVGPGIKSFFPFWFLSDFYSSFKSCEMNVRIHFIFSIQKISKL